MIDTAINHIVDSLNAHFKRITSDPERVVVVSNVLEQDGTVAPHVNNKIVVSLVNIEKENIPLNQSGTASSVAMRAAVSNPPLHFNLYLMFASNSSGDRYEDGLKKLSSTISFLQSQNVFDRSNSPGLDPRIDKLVMDIQNLDMNDLSNLWGILSGKYLPSVLYKVRMVTIDAGAVKGQTPSITKPESSTKPEPSMRH